MLVEGRTTIERAVLYARVSGDDRGKDGRNLTGQIEMGREYAQKSGYRIVAELPEDDRGASGASIDLPQLNKLLKMARQGEYDVLVVRELDRLSRNLAKQLIIEEELRKAGVRVEYVLADYDDTAEGRLQKHIRATVAEYEREKIRERMVRGKRRKVQSGHISSNIAPFGYKLVPIDNKISLEIDETEARIVKMIFDSYDNGLRVSEIISKLNKMNIPTPAERKDLPSKKKQGRCTWSRSTIHKILSNETYNGMWYWGKTQRNNGRLNPKSNWIGVEVEPLVKPEIFNRVQQLKKQNQQGRRGYRKFPYLLSGRVTCGRCGYAMSGLTNTIKGKMHSYYRCTTAKMKIREYSNCDAPNFVAPELDDFVWVWLIELIRDEEKLTAAYERMKEYQASKREPIQNALEVNDDLISQNKRKLKKLLDLYLESDELTQEMLNDRKIRIEHTLERLNEEKIELELKLGKIITEAEFESIKAMASRIAQGIEQAGFAEKQNLFRMFDVRVVVDTPKEEQHKRKNRLQIITVSCVLQPEPEQLELLSKTSNGWAWSIISARR